MIWFNLLLLFVCFHSAVSNGNSIQKTIKFKGRNYMLEGRTLQIDNVDVDYFAKIPYAKPPIGKLRFKYPEPLDELWPSNMTYKSYEQPNSCWQALITSGFDFNNRAAKLWLPKTKFDEDCLYLSLWVPRGQNLKRLSVMVWIYGGSFSSGSTTLDVYNGQELASRENVIVASVQYRLGPLGFMYMDDKECPGNQGLLDQKMGIQWVYEHISQFGGDPSTMTVFGESAGSGSVSLQILSPLSHGLGLFNKAVMQSGSALGTWAVETKKDSLEKANQLAKYSNCNGTKLQKLKCLKSASPESLSNNQFKIKDFITQQRYNIFKDQLKYIRSDARKVVDIFFRPIIDQYFIPKPIPELIEDFKNRTSYASKKFDLIAGFNANEGMYFLIYALSKLMITDDYTVILPDEFSSETLTKNANLLPENVAIEMSLHKSQTYEAIRDLILYNYNIPSRSHDWRKWTKKEVIKALDALVGDRNFVCPTMEFGRLLVNNNSDSNIRVYYYQFIHHTKAMTMPTWTGAMHGYEIEYIFGMPFSSRFKSLYYNYTKREKSLSIAMMNYWANFAKNGNPTPKSYKGEKWPEFKIGDERLMYLGTEDDMNQTFGNSKSEFYRLSKKFKNCRFWYKVMPAIVAAVKKAQYLAYNPIAMVISMLIIVLIN